MIAHITDAHTGKVYPVDDHQQEAFAHVMANDRAALFLGMSLSKTVVMLSALHELHFCEAAISRTLVVGPDKVARLTWPDECEKWEHLRELSYSVVSGDARKRLGALAAPAQIYFIGVDNLTWLIDIYLSKRGGKWSGTLPFDSIVIDESSLFKGRDSQRFKRLRRAIRPIEYRYILTGTPSPQGLIDLWPQIFLLDEGERLGATFGQFVDKYFTTRGNGQIVYEYKPRPGAAAVIADKIKDIALTMRTEDKIELPTVHVVDEHITLTDEERGVYDRLEREYVIEFLDSESETTVSAASDLTMKLLQISSGAVYQDAQYSEVTGKLTPRVWQEVNTAKLKVLSGILDESPEENIICVYQFRHERERIKRAFSFARELATAKDFADWNAGRIRLLIIHPASAGHGLNLQFGGRRMVWTTPTFNLEHYLQTVARIVRRGQVHEVYVHRLIIPNTRDEKCVERLASKETNQTFLMNEIRDLRAKYYKDGNLRK